MSYLAELARVEQRGGDLGEDARLHALRCKSNTNPNPNPNPNPGPDLHEVARSGGEEMLELAAVLSRDRVRVRVRVR